jgi:hypothetical protein
VECCLRYASPQRFFSNIPAAKTRTSRQQFRHARAAGNSTDQLSPPKRLASIKRYARCTKSTASILRISEHQSVLCYPIHVARSGRKFLLGWLETEMGSWKYFNARSTNVQTSPLNQSTPVSSGRFQQNTHEGQFCRLYIGRWSSLQLDATL